MWEPKKDHKGAKNIKAFFKSIETYFQIQIEFSHTHGVFMSNVNIYWFINKPTNAPAL